MISIKKIISLFMVLCIVFTAAAPCITYKVEAASVIKISSASGLKKAMTDNKSRTYRLTKNITGVNSEIKVTGGTKTLDLNGHYIKGKNSTGSLIYVREGKLTLKSSESGGYIRNTGSSDAVGCGKGTLNILSGTYRGKNYGMFVNGGTVNIKGGLIRGEKDGIAIYDGKVNITGGTVKSTESGSGVNMICHGQLIIGGGKVYGAENGIEINAGDCEIKDGYVYSQSKKGAALFMKNKGNIVFNGGKIVNTQKGVILRFDNSYNGNCDIDCSLFGEDEIDGSPPVKISEAGDEVVYKKGMTVTSREELYLAYQDAMNKLEKTFECTCSNVLGEILNDNFSKWAEGKISHITINRTIWPLRTEAEVVFTYASDYEAECYMKDSLLYSHVSEDIPKYCRQIDDIIDKVIKPDMTVKEKAKAVHDYMIKNYSYDYYFKIVSHEFYAPLINGQAVCDGFSRLYALIMKRAGIKCETVLGLASGSPWKRDMEAHMWNVITTDNGNIYYVDVTYDEGVSSSSHISSDFFYKKDSEFYGKKYHYTY